LNYPEDRYNFVVIFDDEEFDGFEAARALSENNLVPNFIFLMISKNDKKGNYLKCITLGIDHYLVKPFDISELISIIKDSFPKLENASLSVDTNRERSEIRILVVEDNKMNQKVIGTMLRALGYSFDLANDGYSGCLLANNNKYDLILMDLIMPEMDGFEASQKILEIDKSSLIVAFTADNMPETKRKAELSGIRDFISKPVRIEDLKKLFAKYF
jgi:CheY-like chemotaxis protein